MVGGDTVDFIPLNMTKASRGTFVDVQLLIFLSGIQYLKICSFTCQKIPLQLYSNEGALN